MKTKSVSLSSFLIIFAGSIFFLGGCQIVQGIGQGVQKTGEKIQEVSRESKSDPSKDGANYDLND